MMTKYGTIYLTRRQMIKNEHQCAATWEKKWDFMRECEESTVIKPIELKGDANGVFPVASPLYEQIEKSETLQNYLITHNTKKIIKRAAPTSKYVFPATTAEVNGWKWCNAPENVDRYYKVEHGRRDPLKWWGGAQESLP